MRKPSVALLVNFVAPCRVRVYERLAATVNLTILRGGIEGDDPNSWHEVTVEAARVRRVCGWQWFIERFDRSGAIDQGYFHLEPGYILELVRERPDGVITDEMGFRTLVALAYGSCFRKPVWIWWGGTVHTERHVSWYRKLLRRVIAHWAKRWISYGQSSTEYLLSLGIPQGRILQVQNCVDEAWYRAAVKPALELQPQPVLLYAGRMIEPKGIAEFLRAAAQLQKEGLTFSVALVGGGRDSAQLQRLAAEIRLSNIHFYPPQLPQAMPAFYRSADAVIFPTMGDVWGLVANEAVLSGVPVLCSRYAGCASELFDPESIFDPADEKQFVTALRRAVTGQLPRADESRLWSSAEVGDIIANAVLGTLRPQVSDGTQAGDRSQVACDPQLKTDAQL